MNRFLMAAATAALMTSTAAFAEEAPRLSGDFASQHVDYSGVNRSNVVGGGYAMVTGVDEEGRPVIAYRDQATVQQGLNGIVPVVRNVGGRDHTVYVPAGALRG
ncbi:hypothetical protein EOD42_11680 [Rhodovarius crocodyli]|uniref:Uncharacterized protein n=1 Tax=Rhodovarius crocodyli TaxID=1979269 RepID=A0A437MHG0_9PROT|nr:hypothetical protein [Rhodovarius crocodyli]RVT97045.1 hypothetical protein EOD42_11680 [Rhodovarius crocodyli]